MIGMLMIWLSGYVKHKPLHTRTQYIPMIMLSWGSFAICIFVIVMYGNSLHTFQSCSPLHVISLLLKKELNPFSV